MQNKEWNFYVNAYPYTVRLKLDENSPNTVLYINDEAHTLQLRSNIPRIVEYHFELEGHKLCFQLVGRACALSLDGVYLDSKKPFVPIHKPTWCWLFVALYVAMFVYTLLTFSIVTASVIGGMGILFARVAYTMNLNPIYSLPKRLAISRVFVICLAVIIWGYQFADILTQWAAQ